MNQHKDIFGAALLDYQQNQIAEHIIVHSPDFDNDTIPVPYLFRDFAEMPKIEQEALKLATGKILDVGCGAGSHSLYLQNEGFDVTALDTSIGAIECCQKRGVQRTLAENIMEHHETYDTLLLLMNGSGIAQNLAQLPTFLSHLKTLLTFGGQILLDSSDIDYLFRDDDGGYWKNVHTNYYGEIKYQLSYKNLTSDWFDWLFIDFTTLSDYCQRQQLTCRKIATGTHHEYLAQITIT